MRNSLYISIAELLSAVQFITDTERYESMTGYKYLGKQVKMVIIGMHCQNKNVVLKDVLCTSILAPSLLRLGRYIEISILSTVSNRIESKSRLSEFRYAFSIL